MDLDVIVNTSVFILPLGNDLFKVGATYNWVDKTSTPTEEGKQELIDRIKEILTCDFEVIQHLAGVRPTVKDRKPLDVYKRQGLRTVDVNKLKFRYSWMDIQAAAKAKAGKRKDFIKTEQIKVYPDTTVWIKDFSYSYNEPMHNDYLWHQAYSQYPVVGVNWHQAKAFCAWRTLYKNSYIKKKKKGNLINSFRLPTEAEWEYSARGGLESASYPWGGPYAKNDRGCFLANFKPNRGDYAADQALYTVEAKSYEPNGYNLYNMSGNVAEWTDSSYDPTAYEFVSSMNPSVGDSKNMRKVVRGGSWKDVAYFLQVGTRDFEYADTARSYIGFRTVQDYMGTVVTGKPARR